MDYLKQNQFYVVENAKTNYNRTQFSMASSLNMNYIPILVDGLYPKENDSALPIYLVNHNFLFIFLQNKGYSITTFNTGWFL